jgi:hypothetical protein
MNALGEQATCMVQQASSAMQKTLIEIEEMARGAQKSPLRGTRLGRNSFSPLFLLVPTICLIVNY